MTTFLQQTFNGLSIGSIYVLVAVGLTLTFGVARVLNFAQGQFLILGSFLGYASVSAGVPWWLSLIWVPVAIGAFGLVMYRSILRRVAGDQLATFILTFGLGIVIQQLIVEIWSPRQFQIASGLNTRGVWIGGAFLSGTRILMIALCVVAVGALIGVLWRTDFGRTMRATAENREMAAMLGVNPLWSASSAFVIGTTLAGVAGVLIGTLFPFTAFSGTTFLINGLAVALAGGVGNVLGAAVVGVGLGLLQTYASAYGVPLGFMTLGFAWHDAYAFVLLIVILAWRPRGLFRSTGAL